MLFVGTSIIHPSTEGVFLLCNILDLLIYSIEHRKYIEEYCMDLEKYKEKVELQEYLENADYA